MTRISRIRKRRQTRSGGFQTAEPKTTAICKSPLLAPASPSVWRTWVGKQYCANEGDKLANRKSKVENRKSIGDFQPRMDPSLPRSCGGYDVARTNPAAAGQICAPHSLP